VVCFKEEAIVELMCTKLALKWDWEVGLGWLYDAKLALKWDWEVGSGWLYDAVLCDLTVAL